MRRIARENRDLVIALQFIVPSVIIMVFFILFPIARAIVMAFHQWLLTSASPPHPFVGFANFAEVFSLTHSRR